MWHAVRFLFKCGALAIAQRCNSCGTAALSFSFILPHWVLCLHLNVDVCVRFHTVVHVFRGDQ